MLFALQARRSAAEKSSLGMLGLCRIGSCTKMRLLAVNTYISALVLTFACTLCETDGTMQCNVSGHEYPMSHSSIDIINIEFQDRLADALCSTSKRCGQGIRLVSASAVVVLSSRHLSTLFISACDD